MGASSLEYSLDQGYGPYPLELVRGYIPVFMGNPVSFHRTVNFIQAVRSDLLTASATFPQHILVEQYDVPALEQIDNCCYVAAEIEFRELQQLVLDGFKNKFLAARRSRSYRTLREEAENREGGVLDDGAAQTEPLVERFSHELSSAGDYAVYLDDVRIVEVQPSLSSESGPSADYGGVVSLDSRRSSEESLEGEAESSYVDELERILGVDLREPEIPIETSSKNSFRLRPKRAAKVVALGPRAGPARVMRN